MRILLLATDQAEESDGGGPGDDTDREIADQEELMKVTIPVVDHQLALCKVCTSDMLLVSTQELNRCSQFSLSWGRLAVSWERVLRLMRLLIDCHCRSGVS